jgi:CubicO group peptidase (beta-lactamase class C family)
MSYEEFVQNRLVDPLEMNNTFAGSSMMKDKSNLQYHIHLNLELSKQ